ncbi:MAG TPA: efflux RND transporter periplasmic adaptor subunit, partial [Vicinamibacterales bacterium]|nr:efflux RND transporter periplasmic adaptor subunit [Vicinamibacterales bacterium]
MKRMVLLAALLLAVAGCSPPPPDPSATAAATATSATPAAGFTVPEAQRGHLEIVAARLVDQPSVLQLTGTVDWDSERTTQAITQVNGPITRIVVDAGARVKAGDPLLYVSSPDIASAVSTYRKARNKLDQAQRTLDRNRDLLAHKAIAQREFDDSQSDFNDASTDLQASLQALKILGVSDADLTTDAAQSGAVRSELPMRSPISGV